MAIVPLLNSLLTLHLTVTILLAIEEFLRLLGVHVVDLCEVD